MLSKVKLMIKLLCNVSMLFQERATPFSFGRLKFNFGCASMCYSCRLM